MATTVTSKGQVTIPKPVRDWLGLEAGSAVEFTVAEDGRVWVSRTGPLLERASAGSRFVRVRGRATVHMRTDEIMALTRGET